MPSPFRIFKETNTSPNARFLRTSYGQKIIDAFFAFAGSFNIFAILICHFEKRIDPNIHIANFGILDLPIFFIPILLDFLTIAAWESGNLFVKIVFGSILGLITIPLNLIRVVIAGVLAFNPLTLFIVFVIHAISQYASGGAELNEKVAKIEEDVVFYNEKTTEHVQVSKNNGKEFVVTWDNPPSDSTSFVASPKFVATHDDQRQTHSRLVGLVFAPVLETPHSKQIGFFYLPLFTDNTNTALTKGAYSMLKLNTWRVTEGMEGYVEMNRNKNKADAQVQKNVAYCEQVLKLIK